MYHMTTKIKVVTKSATVRARIDPALKKRAEMTFKKIGISPSEAINVFFKKVADEQAIPFSLNVPNRETEKAMREVQDPAFRKTAKQYASVEEMMADV